jgi:hypothetical protein
MIIVAYGVNIPRWGRCEKYGVKGTVVWGNWQVLLQPRLVIILNG